ncbi:aminoglycoside phosphotransferase family protein [Paraburkholderia sp. DHOC27]|uniref:aminoglycoside phosphotransferase family protein n=1 Tax=Paraburkholderia sp. DHOC27 TaxID=2303330 RepID=UPI000E3E08F9|nr:aminoglycoside phosphotransferase family protein [Paraburkholderia sp. DHOC27]RFU48477.1 3'-kinase [Paraburkholderia sp. DHOC27]
MFTEYIVRWDLIPDGAPLRTHSSRLLPVRQRDVPAMLKIAQEDEERQGASLMVWWNGEGAARVLAHDGDALLLERAESSHSLIQMVHDGHDDDATRILCAAAEKLHAPRAQTRPELVPLARWFRSLWSASQQHGGLLAQCAHAARELLDSPRDSVVLHGDIHHGNVLDFGARGWLAIDPKGLYGERGFDYANIFCNPDRASAIVAGRFEQRLTCVLEETGMERTRLLQWVLAWSGLSAAWIIEAGEQPEVDIDVAQWALAALSTAKST